MATSALPLVPGRECGTCTVCCVALAIKDKALEKDQGVPCVHLGQGCGIYATRPVTCRDFYCGWRMFKWVRQELRPDQSGVLVRLLVRDDDAAVAFALLDEAALSREGLAESVSAAVMAGVSMSIEVPKAGYMSSTGEANEAFLAAVVARDKASVLQLLRMAWERGDRDHEPPPPAG